MHYQLFLNENVFRVKLNYSRCTSDERSLVIENWTNICSHGSVFLGKNFVSPLFYYCLNSFVKKVLQTFIVATKLFKNENKVYRKIFVGKYVRNGVS